MKTIYRFGIAAFIALISTLLLVSPALADPTTRVGQACTIPPENTAGTIVEGSDGALICRETNPANKAAPRTAPVGNNTTGGASLVTVNSDVKGTCAQFIQDGGIISSNGLIRSLCDTNKQGNAIQVIIDGIANYVLQIGTVLLAVMVGLAGVQILTAGSSPESLKAGKKRLTLALSSLALLVLARLVLGLVGVTTNTFLGVPLDNFNQFTITSIIAAVWSYIQFFGGVLAVAMIAYGGVIMITSTGNPQRIQTARRTITYAVIGLAILISTGLIFNLVRQALTGN